MPATTMPAPLSVPILFLVKTKGIKWCYGYYSPLAILAPHIPSGAHHSLRVALVDRTIITVEQVIGVNNCGLLPPKLILIHPTAHHALTSSCSNPR